VLSTLSQKEKLFLHGDIRYFCLYVCIDVDRSIIELTVLSIVLRNEYMITNELVKRLKTSDIMCKE
jgi:hypothetical protein